MGGISQKKNGKEKSIGEPILNQEKWNKKGELMPFIIAGVVKSMAFSMLGNSKVIEKVIILLLETLAKKTDSDVDDKLVKLLKESLDKSNK